MFIIVVIKLTAPRTDEAPAMCKEKIAASTVKLECPMYSDKGGYIVQPEPIPELTFEEINNKIKEGGKSQKLKLFIRGNDISGAPIIIGTNQLPKPPIKIGITIKKIITRAWEVTKTLYKCSSPNQIPGWDSSVRMIKLKLEPTEADHRPKIK